MITETPASLFAARGSLVGMRVLVTGAAGFAGHHLVEHLLATTDWHVTGLVSFRHRGCPRRLTHLPQSDRFQVLFADLRSPITPRTIDAVGDVDVVINAASESHVDRSITDPADFVANNVSVALHMLEYARKAKPKAFLQVSTDEVYGPAPDGYAHKEWDTILPSNPYSASKAAQEAIAISYWRTYDVPVIISNTMNLIGERQDTEKFVPMVIAKVARGEEITIHGTPDNIGSRFYLHARNWADAHRFFSTRTPTRYRDGAGVDRPDKFHVVGEREVDNLAMATAIAHHVGKPLRHCFENFHATRPGHDRRYALDGAKLKAAGWSLPVPLDASLERTVRWTLEHPEWMR